MSPIWTLWGTALALLLVALAGLLWPLLRESIAQPEGRAGIEARLRSLYRAQRDELDRQSLPPADHRQAVDELQRRLLDDIDRAAATPQARAADGPWQKRAPAAVLSVLLPLAALGLYLQVGDPRAAATLAQAQPDTHAGKGIDADAMVARLAERLQQTPDDLEGWMVLARSREVQEDFPAAAQAYERAADLAARHQAPAELQARLLADRADALASARGGALDGPVQAALDAALALHPDQPKALALAGTAAARRGDRDAARRHWQRLLPLLEPDSDIALRLQNDMAGLDGARATAPLPSGIAGTVRVAAALQGKVQPGDTVFIVARSAAAGPAPLAVLRLPASALPADFVLDDRHAMSPTGPRLSQAVDLTIEARVSPSGTAQRQPGQPSSRALAVRAGSQGVALVIDTLGARPAP